MLIFADTQNAIGDQLSLLPFLFSLNEYLKSNKINNIKKIEILFSYNMKEIIEKIEWNDTIKIIYKKNTIGSHINKAKFTTFIKKSYLLRKEWMNKSYDCVLFLLPYLLIDSQLILNSISFNRCFKMQRENINYKDLKYIFNLDQNEIASKIVWNNLKAKIKLLFFDRKNYNFCNSHISENAINIFNDLFGTNIKYSDNSNFLYIFNENTNKYIDKKDNEKTILFDVGRPDERTFKLEAFINIFNNIKNDNYLIVFVGIKESLNIFFKEEKNIKFKYINLINKVNSLHKLFSIYNEVDFVISYDSSSFHISNILNKKTVCFINSSSNTTRFWFYYYLNYKSSTKKLFLYMHYDYFLSKNNLYTIDYDENKYIYEEIIYMFESFFANKIKKIESKFLV